MLTNEHVRAAGGIVHSDGNIFFTNIDKLNAATAPLLERIEQLEALVKTLEMQSSASIKVLNERGARIAALEAANVELERLCDATYCATGADAYNHACDEMERWQKQRDKSGLQVGTLGSLCDGISWLYGYIAELEAKLAQRVPDGRLHDDGYFTWNSKRHPNGQRPVQLPTDFWLSAAPAAPEQQECKTPRACEYEGVCRGVCKPAAQAPNAQQAETMCRIAKVKLADLIESGHSVCGVMIEKTHSDGKVTRGAVSNGGMVIWWHPESMEAAHSNAQQAEAQEPFAWSVFDGEGGHDLVLYYGNEDYRERFEARNPNLKNWVEPLFTRPQPAQEPMPERQKEELARSYFSPDWEISKAMDVIGEVERHHGIRWKP